MSQAVEKGTDSVFSPQENGGPDPGEICEEWLDLKDPMHRTRTMHEKLIKKYYDAVLNQANASFWCAVALSILGFLVLVGTILVVVHVGMQDPNNTFPVGLVGVISGALIELLSAAVFFVYKRATDQFNTFHTCLERMNRYLASYTINQSIESENTRDQVRRDLACIMASAPMITLPQRAKEAQDVQPSSEGKTPSEQ